MKIAFETTLDGDIAVALEANRRVPRSQQRHSDVAFMSAAFAAVLIGAIAEGQPWLRVLQGFVAGAVAGVATYVSGRAGAERRIRRHVVAARKGQPAPKLTVSIDASGVQCDWEEMVIRVPWIHIVELVEQKSRTLFVARAGTILSVPEYAFGDHGEFRAYCDRARELWVGSGGSESRIDHTKCGSCGYDLFGAQDHECPECGAYVDLQLRRQADDHSGRR